MTAITTFLNALMAVLMELAPWLLFGMLIAGILHVLLPVGFVKRHLGGRRFSSIFKAVSFGVPLPLCSCGVIPASLGLRKDGASKGAATGFLISTPQTGVDSLLVSGHFLGWAFAFFKVISALVSGVIGGLLVNRFADKEAPDIPTEEHEHSPMGDSPPRTPGQALYFGFVKLFRDICRWLIVGVIVAAMISTLFPANSLQDALWARGPLAMVLMLVLSLPMYVCATASVPIAASLVTAGISPGAALVFLMAGPATNMATMGAILKSFGRKTLGIYLSTVIAMSFLLGMLFDGLIAGAVPTEGAVHMLPVWLQAFAVAVMLSLILAYSLDDGIRFVRRFHHRGQANEAAEGQSSSSDKPSQPAHHCPACHSHGQ